MEYKIKVQSAEVAVRKCPLFSYFWCGKPSPSVRTNKLGVLWHTGSLRLTTMFIWQHSWQQTARFAEAPDLWARHVAKASDANVTALKPKRA